MIFFISENAKTLKKKVSQSNDDLETKIIIIKIKQIKAQHSKIANFVYENYLSQSLAMIILSHPGNESNSKVCFRNISSSCTNSPRYCVPFYLYFFDTNVSIEYVDTFMYIFYIYFARFVVVKSSNNDEKRKKSVIKLG